MVDWKGIARQLAEIEDDHAAIPLDPALPVGGHRIVTLMQPEPLVTKTRPSAKMIRTWLWNNRKCRGLARPHAVVTLNRTREHWTLGVGSPVHPDAAARYDRRTHGEDAQGQAQ